jgi:hypothetical protein
MPVSLRRTTATAVVFATIFLVGELASVIEGSMAAERPSVAEGSTAQDMTQSVANGKDKHMCAAIAVCVPDAPVSLAGEDGAGRHAFGV